MSNVYRILQVGHFQTTRYQEPSCLTHNATIIGVKWMMPLFSLATVINIGLRMLTPLPNIYPVSICVTAFTTPPYPFRLADFKSMILSSV